MNTDPRIFEAMAKSSAALGVVLTTSLHMPTYWAPWPGKQNATVGVQSEQATEPILFKKNLKDLWMNIHQMHCRRLHELCFDGSQKMGR
jgi:hypothetical protein